MKYKNEENNVEISVVFNKYRRQGTDELAMYDYALTWNGEVVEHGDDLSCPPWWTDDQVLTTTMGLLSDDTDREIQTPLMVAWFKSSERQALENEVYARENPPKFSARKT